MAVLKSHLLFKARSQCNEEKTGSKSECHPRLKEDPVIFKIEGQLISMIPSFCLLQSKAVFPIRKISNWKIHLPEHYSPSL